MIKTEIEAQVANVLSNLFQGKISEAEAALETLKTLKTLDQVQYAMLSGKILLYRGDYLKALEFYDIALNSHFPSIEALCDSALCLYQLGMMVAFEERLKSALQLYQEEIVNLNQKELFDYGVFLSKLLEESIRIDEALDIINMLGEKQLSPAQRQGICIQKLRLSILKKDLKAVHSLYPLVLKYSQQNLNFEVETDHVLILADFTMFGFSQAVERFEETINKEITDVDRHFLISEMYELAILSDHVEFLKLDKYFVDSQNEYEKQQKSIINLFINRAKDPEVSIVRIEKTLSKMSFLRLVRQMLILFPDSSSYQSWAVKYRFHCLQIPSNEIRTIFLSCLATRTDKLVLDLKLKQVIFDGREDLVKSPFFWRLITVFNGQSSAVDIDEVIRAVYNEAPNGQHFDRLRMAISRLNLQLRRTHGIENLFRLTKSQVEILFNIERLAS